MMNWMLRSVVAVSVLLGTLACGDKSGQYNELDAFLQEFDQELRACEDSVRVANDDTERQVSVDCSRIVFKYSSGWEGKQALLDGLAKSERQELVSRLTRLQARSVQANAQIKGMALSAQPE